MKTRPRPSLVSRASTLAAIMFALNVAHSSSSFRHNNKIPPTDTAVSGNLVLPWNLEATAWTDADHLFRSDPLWLGGDVASSIDLGRGRVLWVFGDSLIADKPGRTRRQSTFVHNSIAIETGYDPAHSSMKFFWPTNNERPTEFAANEGEVWLWPEDGVRLGEKLLLFFVRVHSDSSKDSLGFALVGWTAFLVENPDAEPSTWTLHRIDAPQSPARFIVGSGVIRADNFLYAFACAEPSHDNYLLRWPLADAEQGNLSSPEWWSGNSGWVVQSKLTRQLEPAIPEGSNEFSVLWDSRRNTFFEVESLGFGASDIAIRWADRLEGPWSGPVKIYHPPESDRGDAFVYAGKVHAGLQGADLVVTYVPNSMDDKIFARDMRIYFPRFVRLNLRQR